MPAASEVVESRNSAVRFDGAFAHLRLQGGLRRLATIHLPVVGGLHSRPVAICCSVYVSRYGDITQQNPPSYFQARGSYPPVIPAFIRFQLSARMFVR